MIIINSLDIVLEVFLTLYGTSYVPNLIENWHNFLLIEPKTAAKQIANTRKIMETLDKRGLLRTCDSIITQRLCVVYVKTYTKYYLNYNCKLLLE